MAKFVDRISEMETLEREYRRAEASFVVIYGRRRVGKTELINQFCKDKRALYYLATEESESQNRVAFRDVAALFLGNSLMAQAAFDRWESIFEIIAEACPADERTVIVIDEFQYLGNANPAFPSVFQRIWDTILKDRNAMVILCGSLTTLMTQQVLAYDSPLYGRRTAQIHMRPIPFPVYRDFFPEKSPRELVEFYSVTGGVPKYIELFESGGDVYDAIRDNVFNRDSFLYDEPTFLLQKEVSDVSGYFSIIKAIAAGNRKASAIATRLETPQTSLSRHLKTLIELDMIDREVPVTEPNPENSKKSLYRVKDNFLQFWFQFVQPNLSYLESEHVEFAMERLHRSFTDRLVSYVYEDVCRDAVWGLSAQGKVPLFIQKVGRWWNARNDEIDVVGLSEEDGGILFGECKFLARPVGADVLTALEEKSRLVSWGPSDRREMFVLFSISGFSDKLRDIANRRDDVLLIEGVGQLTR